MGRLYYNGLHWNSGGDIYSPGPQYTAGNQFSSAFVIAMGNITYQPDPNKTAWKTFYNGWADVCFWIQQHAFRTQEIVLRIYWIPALPSVTPTPKPDDNPMLGDPGQSLGNQFYDTIVKPAVVNFGIRNFQVLNELNLEYQQQYTGKTPQQLGGDMYNIAWWIKHRAQSENLGTIYLGFPGPGGNAGNPADPAWSPYWDTYKPYITQGTEQGAAYNWLAPHAYDTPTNLATRMRDQYNSLVSKFSTYPHRWTEYGIPLDNYNCALPCPDLSKFQARANDCRTAILNFKNYVETRSPAGPDVWSVFNYLAFDSSANAQAGQDTRYELVHDNNNLGPAQTLANAF
jgi:hypothetical protein